MLHTVRVAAATDADPLGDDLLAEVRRTLGRRDIARIRTARVYRLEGIDETSARRLAEELLADGVDQRWSLDEPIITDAHTVVEVAYLPGVMNPEAASIRKAAADLNTVPTAVDASREYAFYAAQGASLEPAAIDQIVARLLVNPTIEHVVQSAPTTLIIAGEPGVTRRLEIAAMDDRALMELSATGLYLDLTEMRAIRDHFGTLGRPASDLELEVLAQTWSEHCGHKTFKRPLIVDGQPKEPLIERLAGASRECSDLVVSAFEDNSGVMRFYDGWAVCGKVETHNSPSAIEPYGGAMTGSGGVFRDILGTGQGADVIASTDMFCFAPPDLPAEAVPPGALPPDYLLRRVVAGVRDYGNRMGIPTNNGSVHFHPGFRAKPSVIVGAYGVLPEARARKGRPEAGDRILILGGRTGRDGIHGATFSSVSMSADTQTVNSQAVQIGNAIEEKRLLDAVLACRDADLIRAITDCGAGGFSSAIGEMAEEIGAEVLLNRAPLKYTGLAPWEIFVSESQERMVLAVAPENVTRVSEVCADHNVEATDVGVFEATGRLRVLFADEVVGDLDMSFLHEGLPRATLIAKWTEPGIDAAAGWSGTLEPPPDADGWVRALEAVLGHPDVCSKEPIVRQYDHTVRAQSACQPFGGPEERAPSDAIVLTPLLGKRFGLVIAHGLNPSMMALDPYRGGVWAAVEAMSNLVAAGGNPREVSLIDNFIWPVPDEHWLGALDRAVDACVDVMRALGAPFISGKDSLSSTYRFPDGTVLHIPPVLCVSAFGRIEDVGCTASTDLKRAGDALVLVGCRDVDVQTLGCTAYASAHGADPTGARPPSIDLDRLPATLDAVHAAIKDGAVAACHDISEGGLMTAVAEMAFGGGLGADIDIAALDGRVDVELFGETAGAFVVEIAAGTDPASSFSGVPHTVIGTTTAAPELVVRRGSQRVFSAGIDRLRRAWEQPLQRVFH